MNRWIDCSTTMSWRRPPVGIVRVEMELLKYALQVKDVGYKFCRYDENSRSFIRVFANELEQAIEAIESLSDRSSDTGNVSKLKLLARAIYSRLPFVGQAFARVVFNRFRADLVRLLQSIRHARESVRLLFGFRLRLAQRVDSSVPFVSGDFYFSVGADWGLIDKLYFLQDLKNSIGLRITLFCYDLIPITHPQLAFRHTAHVFPDYFCNVAWCADKVLCISAHSRSILEAFIDEVGAPLPILETVRLGDLYYSPGDSEVSQQVQDVVGSPFILYVSSIERRKNHETLYKAYVRLMQTGCDFIPKLICVGMRGWGVDDVLSDIELDPSVSRLIVVLNGVTDSELKLLYGRCLFTVFPSVTEGWGLPVTESLALGKFCISSRGGALPEAGQGYVDLLDPWAVDDWANAIRECSMPGSVKLAEATEFILQNYRVFSWSDSAQQILRSAFN